MQFSMLYTFIVTVCFNTTTVRDDESAGSLTFILVTKRPADVSFTVQVCTEDVDLGPDLGMATGNNKLLILLYQHNSIENMSETIFVL